MSSEKKNKKKKLNYNYSNDIVKASANKMKYLTSSKTSILLICQFELLNSLWFFFKEILMVVRDWSVDFNFTITSNKRLASSVFTS